MTLKSKEAGMKFRNRSRTLFLIMILCVATLQWSCTSEKKESFKKADFKMDLQNSKGEKVSMEDFRGKVIFMNVWATWCPPCIKEMPTINNLYKEVGDGEVAFLMLTMDQEFEKAIDFRDKNGYDFEIYRLLGAMPAMYHTKLIPTTFVINSAGELVLQHDGMGEFDTAEFKKFLAEVK